MRKTQAFQIGNKSFNNKASLILFIKGILNKYDLNACVNNDDLSFLKFLLTLHPDYLVKVGCGVKAIKIKLDGHWGKTRCFHILRIDGTETDFSYLNCINNSASKEPLKMFKEAARTAIAEQVVTYLINYIKRTIDSNGKVICEKTRTKILRQEAVVDHTPPITFDKIVMDFLEVKKLDLQQIEYHGFGDNEYNKRFKDEKLAKEFSEYHKRIAKLRVISKHQNLTQKKKGFGEQLQLIMDDPI
jgi:hypothetical protein